MRNVQTSIFAGTLILLVGCGAAEGSSEADGGTEVSSQAQEVHQGGFEDATQSIVFEAPANTSWVDLHASIPGAPTLNVRMAKQGNVFRAGPLPVRAGDRISYFFTYFDGQGHDTAASQYDVPANAVPLALRSDVVGYSSGYEIQVTSTADLAWADVHYTINGGPQQNVRLTSNGAVLAHPVSLKLGDTLRYSITYAAEALVFDSAWKQYQPPAGRRFLVDRASDSTNGVCVADASSGGQCNLRAAVAAAQQLGGATTIELAVDSIVDQGQIPLSTSGSHLFIESKRGTSAKQISGASTSKLFGIEAGVTVSLSKLAVRNFTPFGGGAGIWNNGNLELRQVTVSGNKSACSGTGAMTAFATCAGGAVSNFGKMTITAGSRFEQNSVTAEAYTASFTNSSAAGGAIASYGTLVIRPPVAFVGNSAIAKSQSGVHPMPGGAWATSGGGAIYNGGGTLIISGGAPYNCKFTSNSATATASAPAPHSSSADSRGGAIQSSDGTFYRAPQSCEFANNTALQGPDEYVE